MLLKTKDAPTLNSFSIQFLNELCKHRQEFTSDIMKIVVKMLFSETNKAPIIECFSIMIQNRSLPIHLCEEALTELIENLTELDLETALAIEGVIYNAISKSSKLRDLMSTTMRAAMYQNKRGMRKLAVFFFCVMLKKVTKPSQLGFNVHADAKHLNVVADVSVAAADNRKSVDASCQRARALYENLLKAVAANPFIIPNVLELVEPYFRE
jgi:FANCI solenoid 2